MNPSRWKIVAGICLVSAIFATGEDMPHPAPVVGFEMPNEVDAPVDPAENAIAVFDDYSWRVFIAINWPARPGIRGVRMKPKRSAIFPVPAPKSSGGPGRLITSYCHKKEWSLRNGLPSMVLRLAVPCHVKAPGAWRSCVLFRVSGTSIRPVTAGLEGRWSLKIIPTYVLKCG